MNLFFKKIFKQKVSPFRFALFLSLSPFLLEYCIHTPDPENPVQSLRTDANSIYKTKIYNYLELLAKFPSSDYSSLKSIYVSKEGSDLNDGSIENPYKTINKALAKASKGSIVRIFQGEYKENISFTKSGTKTSPIVLFSEDGSGKAILNGDKKEKDLVTVANVKYIVLDGLELKDGNEVAIHLLTPSKTNISRSRYFTIRNCIIHNFGKDLIKASNADYILVEKSELYEVNNIERLDQLIDYTAVHHALFRFNHFHKNDGSLGFIKGGSANIIWVSNYIENFTKSEFTIELGGYTNAGLFRNQDPFSNPEIYQVVFMNNFFKKIEKNPILVVGGIKISFLNNTFLNCSYGISTSFLSVLRPNEVSSKDIKFKGNLIYNELDYPFQKLYATKDINISKITFSYNLFYNEKDKISFNIPGGKGTNIEKKPVFIDSANNNYSLTDESAGKNCNSSVGEIIFDYFDSERIVEDGIDCGAFETPLVETE